jgi:hypothetical protein
MSIDALMLLFVAAGIAVLGLTYLAIRLMKWRQDRREK